MSRKKMCQECKHPWTQKGLLPFDAVCEKCGGHLHACRNCALFDSLAVKGCQIKGSDPGSTPQSKNFCESFIFRESFEEGRKEWKLDRKSAEMVFKELFRDV